MPSTRCVAIWACVVVSIGLGIDARAQSSFASNGPETADRSQEFESVRNTAAPSPRRSRSQEDRLAASPSTSLGEITRAAFVRDEPAGAGAAKDTGNVAGRSPAESAAAGPDARRRADSDRGAPPIPLKPPTRPELGNSSASAAPPSRIGTVTSVLGSLGAVLGVFLVVAWTVRRSMPGTIGLLPREALEVLGRAPLAGRQQVHLIRLGGKLVLVSVTPTGAETLSEVTEPDEVQRLIAMCRQGQPASATSAFRHALEHFGSEPETTRRRAGESEAGNSGFGVRTGRGRGLEEPTDG